MRENNVLHRRLQDLYENTRPPIMVLGATAVVDILAKSLDKRGRARRRRSTAFKDQGDAEQAIDGFKSGEFEILVATDIAGRFLRPHRKAGGDVINYDMPKDIESVHR